MPNPSQFSADRTRPGRWTITFANPPINMFVPTTIVELAALLTDLEADPSVNAVVFQSANPEFFIAHLDVAKAAEQPEILHLWRDFVLRLSSAPIVSIAKIRGRTRGIGNEFVLACDMRFASHAGVAQRAGAASQAPWYRLRCSQRLRIELRPVPPRVREGGRRCEEVGHMNETSPSEES